MKPGWQTDELEDEWIDQDDAATSNFNQNTSDLSLTQPIGSVLITKHEGEDDGGSPPSGSDAGGTFLVREDIPAAPILPKTPGKNNNLVKGFFSPLALEKMFEPPSPPMNNSTPLPPMSTAAPTIPSRLSQVYFPSEEPSFAHEDKLLQVDDLYEEAEEKDIHHLPSDPPTASYQFTFAPPRPSPFNTMGPIPDAQSTPGPANHGSQPEPGPPTTDPRLRLFHFNYDTFTRDHLSAMVDSIAVNTPSGESAYGHSSGDRSLGDLSHISERSISRLRSAKRIKLSPASDYSPSGDGEAVIIRPQAVMRDYVGESKSLMEKIRQTRNFSTISTTKTAQSPATSKGESPLDQLRISHRYLAPPSFSHAEQSGGLLDGGTTSSKRSAYSSLGYREQAANLMAQIRNDMKGPKRLFSMDIDASHMTHATYDLDKSSGIGAVLDQSSIIEGDTEILPENGMHQPMGSPVQNSYQLIQRLDSAGDIDRSLADSLAYISLDSPELLEQFPAPPIGLLVTTPPTAPSSPATQPDSNIDRNPSPSHLAPPTGTIPAYPSSSIRSGRNEDLTRFVSSSTASGTTLTTGSAASFVKHQGPKQITHIAPGDVPALPDRVGRMVFDKVMMRWVKTTALATAGLQEPDPLAGASDGDNDSEDPFRDIDSLREEDTMEQQSSPADHVDDEHAASQELEKSSVLDLQSDSETADEEEVELTSFSFDGLSTEAAPAMGSVQDHDFDDTLSEGDAEQDPTTSAQSNSTELPIDNSIMDYQSDDHTQSNQVQSQPALHDSPPHMIAPALNDTITTPRPPQSALNAPTSVIRSAMKSNSITPISAMKDPNRNYTLTPANRLTHRRSVSFSDGKRDGPIRGIGRNIPTPDVASESELDPNSSQLVEDDTITKSATSILPSARSKRIADMLEGLEDSAFDEESPSKASTGRPPSELQSLKARRASSTKAVVGSPSREVSRRVFSRTESSKTSKSAAKNATFLTECSFGVAHDRLIAVITDVQPFEPYWEELSAIDLSRKNIESVVRLKELLPRLDSLSLNSNHLSWLSGVPDTVRTLSVASNFLTGVTSFSHLLNLENLDISNNKIDSLHQLECLRHLRELRADGNHISDTDGLQRMDVLVKLSLQRNKVRRIDLSKYCWTRLEMLNLSYNRLVTIIGLASLPALVALNLDNNVLGELEPNGPLPRLRILRVSGNRLQQLNASQFPNVRTLYADNNSLGPILKASHLTKLENLSLRNQGGRNALSLSIHDVRDVRRLYLSGNPMRPGFISEPCYNLVYLELAACRLSSLPEDLSRVVPNLRVLNLNYNFLEDTRPLEGLTRLRKLTIIGSRIKTTKYLVRVLRGMLDIEMLDFRMNPCTLGWYLPLLVKDVPGALQPSDGDRKKADSNPTEHPHARINEGTGRNGHKAKGTKNKMVEGQTISPTNSGPTGNAAESSNGGGNSSIVSSESGGGGVSSGAVTWKDLDSKFRRDLPDDAYVGRLVYRGMVMRTCPSIRMLDGVEVSDKEKDKAERLLQGVMGPKREKRKVKESEKDED